MQPVGGFRLYTLVYPLIAIAQFAVSFSIPSLAPPKVFAARGKSLSKRANTTSIPAPLVIPPSQYWDGNDGPWSSFELMVGTPAQSMRVLLSTAATFTWTVGDGGCPYMYVSDCRNQRGFLFLPNQSLTWVPNSVYAFELEDNIGFDSSGNAGFDTVTLGFPGQGGPTINHSVVFDIYDSKYWLGEFGLNPRPTNFTTFADPQPSYLQSLATANLTPSVSYGYTAGNQYRFDKVFGSLVLGGYDQNRFTPTNVTFPFYEDISRDLLVNIQAITSDSPTRSTNLLPGGSIAAFVDSTVPYIYLPASACTAFEHAFGIRYNTDYGLYLVNDSQHHDLLNQNASVTFTLGPQPTGGDTVQVTLPYSAFDLQVSFPLVENPNTSYYFPLMRAQNNTQYTLGRTFLQEAYLIADYERQNFTIAPCAWNQQNVATADMKTILSPTAVIGSGGSNGVDSRRARGTLAGVVVGAVALVTLLALMLWLWIRRRQTQKRRIAALEASEGKGSPDVDNNQRPLISNPMGGELGGDGGIHELHAPYRKHVLEMDSPYKVDPKQVGYSEAPGAEYFGPGRGFAHEVQGNHHPIYEMVGSEVQEMPGNQTEAGK